MNNLDKEELTGNNNVYDNRKMLEVTRYTKILVPAKSYDVKSDRRLLIPFTMGQKIGFVNSQGQIIVHPKYSMYYGDCYDEKDYVRVCKPYSYGFPRSNGNVSSYARPIYGLINFKGEEVLPMEYFSICPSLGNKSLFSVQKKNYQHGVITADGKVVVPFGRYSWIDGYDKGLARVKKGNITNGLANSGAKWGLIDEEGNEVLPVEYDNIWNFYGKNRLSTMVVKDKRQSELFFHDINDGIPYPAWKEKHYSQDNQYEGGTYGLHYGEYAGSYAQDVMGYSDEVIDDAFDGDPDAYWNID